MSMSTVSPFNAADVVHGLTLIYRMDDEPLELGDRDRHPRYFKA